MLYTPVYSDARKLEQSVEYDLPDYIPDIRRVLGCEAFADVKNEYRSDGVIRYDGDVVYSVTLLGEDDSISNINIAGGFEGETVYDTGEIMLDFDVEDISVRAVDMRKLQCRSRVAVTSVSEVYTETDMSPEHTADGIYLEVLRNVVNTARTATLRTDEIILSEDIELDVSYPEIARIVYCKCTPCISECRVSGGGVSVHGELTSEILYADASGNYRCVTKKSRLSENLQSDELSADWACCASMRVSEINVQSATNSFGEEKIVELDVVYNVTVNCASNEEVSVISDVYSPEVYIEAIMKNIPAAVYEGCIGGNFTFTGSKTYSEVSLSPESEIVCTHAFLRTGRILRAENGKLVCTGEIVYDLILTEEDHKAGVRCTFPVKYETSLDPGSDAYRVNPELSLISYKAKKDGTGLSFEAEIGVCGLVTVMKNYEIVCGVKVSGERAENGSSVTLFYPDGQSLWEIAKESGVPASDILEANDATETDILAKRVILIPHSKRKKEDD